MGSLQDEFVKKFGIANPKKERKEKNWTEKEARYNSMSRENFKGGSFSQNRNMQNNNTNRENSVRKNMAKPVFRTSSYEFASAPYNFVTLPDMIVPSPLDQSLDWKEMNDRELRVTYKDYILEHGKLSGRIELEIETVTPCFIGGNGEEFYAPNGIPVIPGSTLRGMTKNLLKIISCGSMKGEEDFYDRHLYFRDFASKENAKHTLKDYYAGKMVEEVNNEIVKNDDSNTSTKKKLVTKASPGFLFKIKEKYYVCPTKDHIVPDRRQIKCNNDRMGRIVWNQDGTVTIFTGRMNTKKSYVYFDKPVFSLNCCIEVPDKVIEEYRADKSRKGLDLLKYGQKNNSASGYTHLEDVTYVVPCYYKVKNGMVEHFGHGRYYRIAYDNSIGDHVPENLQGRTIDFADALFGAKGLWASRLYFDDAQLVGGNKPLKKEYRIPLLQSNPTSFQLYLKQENENIIKHWGEKAEIRGYKLYWHQAIGDTAWQHPLTKIDPDRLTDKQKDSLKKIGNITKKIQPLAKDSNFRGNIRFSNLSEVELGALCKVFRLSEHGEDIVYKLGQGKSIGMGSVRVKAKLFLENVAERYECLFGMDGWNNAEEEKDMFAFCNAFRLYLNQALGDNHKRYDLGMRELMTIMNWKHTANPNWKEKTAMMNPTQKGDNRLKDRVILQNALEFVAPGHKQ